jgi:Xaa-Pro aminopeptidase
MLGFETLTLAPLHTPLIDLALLSDDEIEWINAYHARVCAAIAPQVDADTAAWLEKETAPLSRT